VSTPFDLAEFLSAFVAEADEQLTLAGAKLLAIEAAARRGERDPRPIRDLFRSMHTLKGLAAMVGVEPIVTIAHAVETVLREAERATKPLEPGASDLLLQAVHAMNGAVRAVERGAAVPVPSNALLAQIESLASGAPAAREGERSAVRADLLIDPAIDAKLDPFERDLLLKGIRAGRRALRIDFAPSPARAAEGLTISTARERIGALAEIVRIVPLTVPMAEGAPAGIAFALLIVTDASNAQLALAAGIAEGEVRSLVRDAPQLETTPREDESALAPPESMIPEAEHEAPRRNLLRVDVSRVDDAMDRLASLLVTRSRLLRAIAKVAEAGVDVRELNQVASENSRNLRDLRASILQVRMVPVAELVERIPLLLRALTRGTDRQVHLEVETGGAELDKGVAERVFPALVHLVRNAVDHGIEPAPERLRARKPAEGLIRIASIARTSGRLELAVRDDGRGIDAEAVAKRANAPVPHSNEALLELLCRPGLSTRDAATTTSGRGMGMDIARRIIVEDLGGELSLETEPGVGTTFVVKIPLTVAIVDVFVIECASERFVLPVSVVEEIVDLTTDRLMPPAVTKGAFHKPSGILHRRGESVLVYELGGILGLPGQASAARAVVIRRGGQPLAFSLARVAGQQEAVVRPLLDPLVRVPGISAATDLGDGRPTLVLDLMTLAAQGQRRGGVAALPRAAASDMRRLGDGS
jgi:two-component system chemotaxis sensor kinase CheA